MEGEQYAAIYQVACTVCEASPVVAIVTPSGVITSSGLCGVHFFGGDRSMIDPDNWNDEREATE